VKEVRFLINIAQQGNVRPCYGKAVCPSVRLPQTCVGGAAQNGDSQEHQTF